VTYTILLADSDPGFRVTAKDAFALINASLRVVTAETGSDALDKAGEEDFDLVIMDIHMPIMDGLEVLKIIHMNDPGLPVLVVTDADDGTDRGDILAAGAHMIIPKPIDRAEFTDTVKKLLGIYEDR